MRIHRAAITGLGTTDAIAQAIQRMEGYAPGTRAYRNNNPGNLRYVGQPGATGADTSGFAIFPSYDAGYAALQKQIELDASRGLTIEQFIAKYAPPNENDTTNYTTRITEWTGFDPGMPLMDAISGDSTGATPSGEQNGTWDTLDPEQEPSPVMLYVGIAAAALLAFWFGSRG